jgi:hypothetical protein
MKVVSRFRTGYWIKQFLNYFWGFFIIGLFLYMTFDNGQFDYLNGLFWIAVMGTILLTLNVLYFMFNELKQLTVIDEGIEIKYLLTRKTDLIRYNEIMSFATRRIRQRQGAGSSDGYFEFQIHLPNDRVISFDEDQFDNYDEIKNQINFYRKKSFEQ